MTNPIRRTLAGALAILLAVAVSAWLPSAWSGQDSGAGAQGERPPPGLLYPRTFVLVRHAEKAAEPARDPLLDDAGVLRAERLAGLLRHSGVTHLFASEFQRTRLTLTPLSKAVGVDIATVQARDKAGLLSALDNLPRHAVAVVAGHSNTVGGIVAALAPDAWLVARNPGALELGEADYDRVFLVTQWAPGRQGANVVELRY